jgi:hypothetical protein
MSVRDTQESTPEKPTFLKRMIALRLVDKTEVYAREHIQDSERISVKRVKYVVVDGDERKIQRFDDDEEMRIHRDAIEVWFVLHKGEKNEVSEVPDGAPAPTQHV